MPAMLELKPNRTLLDANFYGYKLSLESVPNFQLPFECGVDHVSPSDEQYSFLHVKAFGFHNHLCADPWDQRTVYFIDKQRSIQHVHLSSTSRPERLVRAWEVPGCREHRAGQYNMCLIFPSPELAVVTDGTGALHVVATGQRPSTAWQVLFSGNVSEKEVPFILLHSRLNTAAGLREIHCILWHIDESVSRERSENKESGPAFMNVLEWVVITEDCDRSWNLKARRQLCASGNLEYAAVEESCQSIYVAANKDVKFTADSEKPIELLPQHETKVDKEKPDYMWLQTLEDITVWFQLPQETAKCEVTVSALSRQLTVTWRDHVLLTGSPWHVLDPDVTTWTLEKGKLEVALSKAEQGLMWQELVKDDQRGEEVVDPALVAEIHERLAHLCSDKLLTDPAGGCPTGLNSQQLEECDAFPMDSAVLARLDSNTHTASHQINLGGHQWLFSTQLRPGPVPAICLRNDVDGCVWQPETPQAGDETWPCTHVGTFHAFGYVLASKQQRKFTVCAPDLSYVAVCEASRHVYLYRQPSAIAGELRNRHTGQQVAQVAKQQLVNLDNGFEVLGVHATNSVLFILCSECLVVLHVNEA